MDIPLGRVTTHFGIHGDQDGDITLGTHGLLLSDGVMATDGDMILIGPDIIKVIIMAIMPETIILEVEEVEPGSALLEEVVDQGHFLPLEGMLAVQLKILLMQG